MSDQIATMRRFVKDEAPSSLKLIDLWSFEEDAAPIFDRVTHEARLQNCDQWRSLMGQNLRDFMRQLASTLLQKACPSSLLEVDDDGKSLKERTTAVIDDVDFESGVVCCLKYSPVRDDWTAANGIKKMFGKLPLLAMTRAKLRLIKAHKSKTQYKMFKSRECLFMAPVVEQDFIKVKKQIKNSLFLWPAAALAEKEDGSGVRDLK